MKAVVKDWLERYLSDPEAVILAILLIVAVLFISTTLTMLAPVFAGLVIAYLLEGLVARLEKIKVKHAIAVILVYLFFMTSLIVILFWVAPLFFRQLSSFAAELPQVLGKAQVFLNHLPDEYPQYISHEQMTGFVTELKQSTGKLGQALLSLSFTSIPSVLTLGVFLVLLPLLVFFFMLDRDKITRWVTGFLPDKRDVMSKIWYQVDLQLGNYVRGKVLEIIIVSVVTYVVFSLMQLLYMHFAWVSGNCVSD